MRILLLLLAITATLCAQSPASNASVPGWQSIVNSMLSQTSGPANTGAANTGVSPFGAVPTTGNLAAIRPSPVLAPGLQTFVLESQASAQSGATPASPCSVPLLKAQIPTDVNFTMQVIEPPTTKVDHMQVVVPAPACPESPR
jgi:hypothetical protein